MVREFHGTVKRVEFDPREVLVVGALQNEAVIGVGLDGVNLVLLDEIMAVVQGSPLLGYAPVTQQILYRQSA